MPRSPAPEAQQAVAGWALCMHVGTPLIGHHEGAALGVGAIQLGSLRYGCFCCHLHIGTDTETTSSMHGGWQEEQ